MKELTLTQHLQSKLSRAQPEPDILQFTGVDPAYIQSRKVVAIVGTRKPTPYGIATTKQYAEALARAGVVVVSGLALGIDGIAHGACLDAGGVTIAVLPSGLDNVYPATNRTIAKRILDNGGTLMSEFQAGHVPHRKDFLHRNRLVATLADAVLIPEAAASSGSLNTAKHAKNASIPVFCVPGNTTSPMSAGTNQLIVAGEAHATISPNDILAYLDIDNNHQQSLNLTGANKAESAILAAISSGFSATNDIQKQSGLSLTDCQTNLTMLEIAGIINCDALGAWHLV